MADKALVVLCHLSRRGSVWPDASAAAVRELRDRITQRPSRSAETTQPSLTSSETNMSYDRSFEQGSMSPRYRSSSGVNVSTEEPFIEPHPTISSTGLLQDLAGSHTVQSAAGRSSGPNIGLSQASGAPQQAENIQLFNNGLSIPYNNMNTPVFDFGSSEWSDFIQANENLDTSTTLLQADGIDQYIGFDIPFWLGQDQSWDMMHDRN